MEIWKDIPNTDGIYQASNTGKIRSTTYRGKPRLHELKPQKQNAGYLTVCLAINNIHKTCLVHRLVAITFLEKPFDCDFVNHKDENKMNNNVDNLEWCTKSYNSIYYLNFDENRKKEYASRFRKTSPMIQHIPKTHFEKVIQSTKDGGFIKEWNSVTEASLNTGISLCNILSACKRNARTDRVRKRKYKASTSGFVWEFK